MSHASSTPTCRCGGNVCRTANKLHEMMSTLESLQRLLSEEASIPVLIQNMSYLATVMSTCITTWLEAVTTCEVGKANLALASGTYVRPTTSTRYQVEAEGRNVERWHQSEHQKWEHRLRQVQHGITTHQAFLKTCRDEWHLHPDCIPACQASLEAFIEQRENQLETLAQTLASNQDMEYLWEEQWKREEVRLRSEHAHVPQLFQPGLEQAQHQRMLYVCTGVGRPVSQTQMRNQYTLQVLERQLDLSSQHAIRFLALRRETWTLLVQRTQAESHRNVLSALLEQWLHLQAVLETPSPDVASLEPLILQWFTV